MASREFCRSSSGSSSGDHDSDSSFTKSHTIDSANDSDFLSDSEIRSSTFRDLPKDSKPHESPSLDDDLELGEFLEGSDNDVLICQDVGNLRETLGVPTECNLRIPRTGDDCHSPPEGYFTVFLEYFTSGLLCPPQPLLVELVGSLGMSFSQLTPNAIIVFSAFCHRMTEIQLPLSVELFHSLFSARRSKPDSYVHFQPRVKCKFLSRIPSPRSSWKSHFFYIKDCGWEVPVVWSPELRVIAIRGVHLALQQKCRSLGLFDELFDPRSLIVAGDRFNLATIRARKANMGRRSPFMGNSRAFTNHTAPVSHGTTRREVLPERSQHGRGSESQAQKKPNSSSSNKVLESRAANGEGSQARKGTHEDLRKKVDEEVSRHSKRSRTEDQGASSKTSSTKNIFVEGVNHREKADSFWDLNDPEIGWKKGRSIVGDFDILHLMSQSTDSFAHSLAWNCCQGLSLASALRVREEKLRSDQSKLQDEVAKLKEETHRLRGEKEKSCMELVQTQGKLADVLENFKVLEEKHATELKTGGQFLASEVGKTLLKSTKEEGVKEFKASPAFREEVLDRAMVIHDEAVLDCRRQLRETGLVPEEVVMMIEPDVLEVGGGLVDPLGDAEVIEALNLLPLQDEP